MKTMRLFFKLLLPLGLMAILFQGCYTQLVTSREEDSSYQEEQQSTAQNDNNYYNEDNDNWQSHQYLGFSYYYPTWRSNWSWDYGCVYPTYWDPWYWGSAFYAGYSYYPHHFGYGNSYSGYGYGYGHSNYPRSFVTRNSGYQRGGNNRHNYGSARSGNDGTGTLYNGQVGTNRGDVNLPRSAGSVRTQSGNTGTTRTSNGVSTTRQSSGSRYNPSVQQPRYRDQSAPMTRSTRTGSSHGRVNSQNQGTNNGQSRSSVRSSAPAPRVNSTPSTPAPSRGGSSERSSGGGERSGGSGRSR